MQVKLSDYIALLLPAILLVTGCKPGKTVNPVVEKSVLDATKHDIHISEIPLGGNWAFTWGEWIDPVGTLVKQNATALSSPDVRLVPVPEHWTNYQINIHESSPEPEKYPVSGKASFWIQIRLNPDIKDVSLRIPAMDTAFVMYWNGKEIARNGVLTEDIKNTKPVYYAPQYVNVPAQSINSLLLHMGNSDYPRPGLRDLIQIGSEDLISQIEERNLFFAAFLVGALTLMALYHLGMYAMRKEDRSPLYFSLFCLIVSIRLMVTGEGLAFRFFPVTWNHSTFLEYTTFYLAPVPFLLFLHSLYPKEKVPYFSTVISLLSSAFVLTVVILPIGLYTQTLVYFQAIAAIAMIYSFGVIITATIRGRETARSFLLGILALSLTLVNDILFSLRLIESAYLVPVGVFLFFFSQAFLLSRRFSIAFRTAETLTEKLEIKVEQRTKDLQSEKDRADRLLRNILPESVATELKDKGNVQPQYHPAVTVLFIDFVNFTSISEKWHPDELVSELHKCFSAFDEIMARNNMEKLKTIGDSYMAAAGIPEATPDHAYLACEAALEIASWMKAYQSRMEMGGRRIWNFRTGLNSGPVTAGVIGTSKFVYDIWGDTVNTASRVEHFAQPGQINLSQSTCDLVTDQYDCIQREMVDVPGKGMMQLYSLHRKNSGSA